MPISLGLLTSIIHEEKIVYILSIYLKNVNLICVFDWICCSMPLRWASNIINICILFPASTPNINWIIWKLRMKAQKSRLNIHLMLCHFLSLSIQCSMYLIKAFFVKFWFLWALLLFLLSMHPPGPDYRCKLLDIRQ